MEERLEGLIPAVFTPMDSSGAVLHDRIGPYAEYLIERGVSGLFVCGSTGEGVSLTLDERRAVTERWIDAAGARLPVIVHVGALCLEDSRALARHAAASGARAIATIPPVVFRPRHVDDLVAACAHVAEAAPETPFFYYHIPAQTGVSFDVADFFEAARDRIPNLAGAKFTHENLMDFGRCLSMEGGRYTMLFGRDEILLSALALGARGAVGTTYNFAAPLFLQTIETFDSGDLARARELQQRAFEMVAVLRRYGGLRACKTVMKLIGVDLGPTRLPIVALDDDETKALRRALDEIGFFDR
jgi:N-acetylneuraminate lyase